MMLLQAQLQPLHSLTNGGGAVTGVATKWQVVINKGILMQCATTAEIQNNHTP